MAILKINKPRFLSKMLLFGISAVLLSIRTFGQAALTHESSEVTLQINVNSEERYQVFEHFGASDAWSTQFVGLWPDQKKNAMAELLFSRENDEKGNPKGIGLSLWRFNVGAGSSGQGDDSGIKDEWRRAESFINRDGTYDWSRQAGQVWFAKAAKDHGVGKLLIFANSPPVSMTKTGKAFAKDGQSNLTEIDFDEFAEYLAQVIKGLNQKGLEVDYVSPVNEPQWDWSDGGQEGTPFWNNEIAGIAKALDHALGKHQLATKIDVAEAGKVNYLYEQADKEGRGHQIAEFFDSGSGNFLGDLPHLSSNISAHSYFTTSPFESAVSHRERLNEKIKSVDGLGYWMSEYCILGDNEGEINGRGRDLGIDPALYLARVIHTDLVVSNASAWHWWLAISPYDYKDGLIYIDKDKEDGEYYESKMLWAMGNYSRFVRPGYQRVAVEINGQTEQFPELLVSSYVSQDQDEVVLVLVNSGSERINLTLSLNGNPKSISGLYITSKEKNLKLEELPNGSMEGIMVPAKSIITAIIDN